MCNGCAERCRTGPEGAHFCFSRKRRCASRFLERRSSFLLLRFSPAPLPRPRLLLRPDVAAGPSYEGEGTCDPRLPAQRHRHAQLPDVLLRPGGQAPSGSWGHMVMRQHYATSWVVPGHPHT